MSLGETLSSIVGFTENVNCLLPLLRHECGEDLTLFSPLLEYRAKNEREYISIREEKGGTKMEV